MWQRVMTAAYHACWGILGCYRRHIGAVLYCVRDDLIGSIVIVPEQHMTIKTGWTFLKLYTDSKVDTCAVVCITSAAPGKQTDCSVQKQARLTC